MNKLGDFDLTKPKSVKLTNTFQSKHMWYNIWSVLFQNIQPLFSQEQDYTHRCQNSDSSSFPVWKIADYVLFNSLML